MVGTRHLAVLSAINMRFDKNRSWSDTQSNWFRNSTKQSFFAIALTGAWSHFCQTAKVAR